MHVLAPHRLQLASQAAAVGAMLQNSHSSLSITLETHCGGSYSDGTCERGQREEGVESKISLIFYNIDLNRDITNKARLFM